MAATVAAVAAAVWTMACYFGGMRLLAAPIAREAPDFRCAQCLRPWSSMTAAERSQVAEGVSVRPVTNGERPRAPHQLTAMAS
ncbi:hypothetical protein ACWEQA_25020 [Nocardia sp. NPDC004085]